VPPEIAAIHDNCQRILQDAHHVKAAPRRQRVLLTPGQLPCGLRTLRLEEAREAMSLRRDQVREHRFAVLLARRRVDDEAQVVAQRLQDRQESLGQDCLRRRSRGLSRF
jgi:hypothetical protein